MTLSPFWRGAAGILLLAVPAIAKTQQGEALSKAVAEIERIDALRSGLAATFRQSGAPADQQAFNQVCKPVGQSVQQVAAANGWTMRQVALRNRNPANAADAEAAVQLRRFEREPALQSVVLTTTLNGQPGVRYLRRITVESSCLACHGARESRPAFVKENYPQDKAYAFKAGDLRGAYSVFMPTRAPAR
jgi:hypothetical protein